MSATTFPKIILVAFIALTGLASAGCPGKSDPAKSAPDKAAASTGGTEKGTSDKSAAWEGTYEQQSADKMVLVIKPDHKGTLAPPGQAAAEITWEVVGDDKITVHFAIPLSLFRTSDGNLRDEEGTTWKKK